MANQTFKEVLSKETIASCGRCAEGLKEIICGLSEKHPGIASYFINRFLVDCSTYDDDGYFPLLKECNLIFEQAIIQAFEDKNLKINIHPNYKFAVIFQLLDRCEKQAGDISAQKQKMIVELVVKEMLRNLETLLRPEHVTLNRAIHELHDVANYLKRLASGGEQTTSVKDQAAWDEAKAVNKYAQDLLELSEKFFKDAKHTDKELQSFKNDFSQLMNKALKDKVLLKHYDCRRIMFNILISLTVVGLFFAAADMIYALSTGALKTGGQSLFWRTPAESAMHSLKKTYERAVLPSPSL